MIKFKEFLNEAQWMYHGTPDTNIDTLKPDRSDMVIDRALGSHFAAAPEISRKFASGIYKNTKGPGTIFKTNDIKRSELQVIHQRRNKNGALQSDQHAISSHVLGTVLGHPDNKEMFKSWIKYARNIDDNTAEEVHNHLSSGRAPSDRDKFGTAASKFNSFKKYIGDYDSGLHMQPEPNFKEKVVNKYLDIMRSRGIKGLVYKNTAPMEKNPEPRSKGENMENRRSNKNYIVFDPDKLNLTKHE
ncbi:MAG: hypothetical protein NTZ20_05010 [Candidatus Levybacteria bacterium]|nr:hypothetical protein [Candidatus Levybacteria bacterium]